MSGNQRICRWCKASLVDQRRDAIFCSTKCRQASWRFYVSPAPAGTTDRPMVFAYADPPYPGKAKYYPESEEVNHVSLIDRLTTDYPDGWALSTSSEALRDVLSVCPAGAKVCAWFKGQRPTKSRRALVSWEPLIVVGGRPLQIDCVQERRDGLIAQGRFRAFPGAMIGMKPPAFAEWMFGLLGVARGDRLDDIFPGSGAVSVALERYLSGPGDASASCSQRHVASCRRQASLTPGQESSFQDLADPSRLEAARI